MDGMTVCLSLLQLKAWWGPRGDTDCKLGSSILMLRIAEYSEININKKTEAPKGVEWVEKSPWMYH